MMPRLLYIVTHPISARLLLGHQLAFMRDQGYDVTVICSPGEDLEPLVEEPGIDVVMIPMERTISPLRDLRALWTIFRAMRRLRPDIVNASTPKAGLLGMLAAWAVNAPVRIYLQRGLRLETTRGWKRFLLGSLERLAAGCSHEVVCISDSLREQYVKLGLASKTKTVVLGAGSSGGTDVDRFSRDEQALEKARTIRAAIGLTEASPVIGFIGRFTRDKGIVDLADAYEQLHSIAPEAKLLLVGDFEVGDPVPDACIQRLVDHPDVLILPWCDDPVPIYALIDILTLPSYREGFGNVAIEAAAMEVPVVAYRATGVVDAVEDGETGILVPVGDSKALSDALLRCLKEPQLRRIYGKAGRRRAVKLFRRELVWNRWHTFYEELLTEHGLDPPAGCESDASSLLANE